MREGEFETIVDAAPTIGVDSLVSWTAPSWRDRDPYTLPRCFAVDGVVWGVIARRLEDKWQTFTRDDLISIPLENRDKLVTFLAEGVDGGLRVPRIRCPAAPATDAYWGKALAYLADGRACRRLGRPLYRLSTARGSFLDVDLILSSEPAEGKVMTSFGVDQAADLVKFVGSLSAQRRGELTLPAVGDWPAPTVPTAIEDFLDRVRSSIVREFPPEGLKLLPIDLVSAYVDLLDGQSVVEAILTIGNALGLDPDAPLKASKPHADDWNRPFERMRAIVDLPFRRVVQFGLGEMVKIDDEDLAVAFGQKGVFG